MQILSNTWTWVLSGFLPSEPKIETILPMSLSIATVKEQDPKRVVPIDDEEVPLLFCNAQGTLVPWTNLSYQERMIKLKERRNYHIKQADLAMQSITKLLKEEYLPKK